MPRRHRSARGLLRTVIALVGLAMAALLTAGASASPQLIGLEIGNLGGTTSGASAVNDSGQVVGWSDVDERSGDVGTHAVLWSAGMLTDLGTFVGTGDLSSEADDINNSGQVVGWSDISGGEHAHAFLWSSGTM